MRSRIRNHLIHQGQYFYLPHNFKFYKKFYVYLYLNHIIYISEAKQLP